MNNATCTTTAIVLSAGLALAACSGPSEDEPEAAQLTAEAPATPGTEKSAAQAEAFAERPPSARLPGDPSDGSEIDAQSQQAFMDLDKNDNGLISAEEAVAEDGLTQRWEELDNDTDNQLDAVEFSKFESASEDSAPVSDSQKDQQK